VIVTRQRRKPFKWRRYALPLVAIALVAFAVWWTPSRNEIVNGPLAPVWRALTPAATAIAAPFHFAAQNQIITDRNRQIAKLQSQMTQTQTETQSKQKQIAQLQSQVSQLQTQAANANATQSAPVAQSSGSPLGSSTTGSNGNATIGSGDLSAGATADMRRTAQYWASMDPENVAKVVQRLPTPYVARIFALMSPDSVGAVLDALPPTYAAQLTQEDPELRR